MTELNMEKPRLYKQYEFNCTILIYIIFEYQTCYSRLVYFEGGTKSRFDYWINSNSSIIVTLCRKSGHPSVCNGASHPSLPTPTTSPSLVRLFPLFFPHVPVFFIFSVWVWASVRLSGPGVWCDGIAQIIHCCKSWQWSSPRQTVGGRCQFVKQSLNRRTKKNRSVPMAATPYFSNISVCPEKSPKLIRCSTPFGIIRLQREMCVQCSGFPIIRVLRG